MSMSDALRGLRDKVSWLNYGSAEPIQAPRQPTVVEEMAELVQMAQREGVVDRRSGTWIAVSSWAANELLQTFAKQEGADDAKAATLRARARALRDLLCMDERPLVVKIKDVVAGY